MPTIPAIGDALLMIDVQNDFLPRGSLAVRALPIIATRDWHPVNHCSFRSQGGEWPAHCVTGSKGAEFAADLRIPDTAIVLSKATLPSADAYSGFEGTALATQLHAMGVKRLFVGGLATDYCVLATVSDALQQDWASSCCKTLSER